jgi:hypothetical protein
MNNVLDLFKGVGVIIDDDLNPAKKKATDSIWKIKKSFEDKNIPILTYYELPYDKVKSFNSINFLLLDWDLIGLEQGIDLPQAAIDDNVVFIQQFNSVCFAPIFIFSNESKQDIKLQLVNAGLYNELKSNHIFVESKSELKDAQSLFTKIKDWIKQTPSIYVLKEWEFSLQQAKNSLFWDFYNINPEWAKILYETIKNDNADLSYEMNEILFENLKTRTLPIDFDLSVLSAATATAITSDEIKSVLEGQRFRKHNLNMIFTGDIFFQDNKYYVNVRPQCDCIPRGGEKTIYDVKLYFIEGKEINIETISKKEKLKLLNDSEISNSIIFPINDGKAVKFDFKEFSIESFMDWKDNRIGTLLPPFITKLIQKYAFYLQRQGLPAIPDRAIK